MNKYVVCFAILWMVFATSVHATSLSIETSKGAVMFDVEVADTPYRQMQGLMFRKSLAPQSGMFFQGETPKIWNMWMKNTLIPLDIIFIDKRGIVTKIIPNAVPHDETILSSDTEVLNVLEIEGGGTKANGIDIGDKIMLQKKQISDKNGRL